MNIRKLFSLSSLFLLSRMLTLSAQPAADEAGMLTGPATAKLEGIAQIEVPAGYVFFDGAATRKRLKQHGQPVSGNEMGFLKPLDAPWAIIFEFDETGYVKDDDKDKLNADKLLKAISEGTEASNEERKSMGSAAIHVVGWEQPPHYDPQTHNLEWGINATVEGDNEPIVNYNTRLLGRRGVMEVVLIADAKDLPATLPTFKGLLANYKFQSGQTYAEYKQGDKVAKYGLAALIVGGAALGAAKLGLFAWLAFAFKKFAKLIVVGVVAVIAFFRKILGRLFGRRDESTTS